MNRIHIGIRAKLTLLLLLLTLTPVAILGWRAYHEQRRVITDEVTRSHQELSNVLAHGIYENLFAARRLMKTIAALDVIRDLNPIIAEDFLHALIERFTFFTVIYLIDPNSTIVATTDKSVVLPGDWLFTTAQKRSYAGALSKVYRSVEGTHYMTMEEIIYGRHKDITGALISRIDLKYVADLLETALRGSKSQGLILDESGVVIAASSADVKTFQFSAAEVRDSDVTCLRTIDDQRFLVTAVSLKKFEAYAGANWTIVLQIPEQIAFQAAYKLRQTIITMLGVTAIIACLVAVFMANSFIAPLYNLIQGARRIGRGDFDYQVIPQSADEIGELATTFDEMRINLKNTKADLDYRILQLSTLYEVGKAISSVLDFNHLQRMILEIVVKVMRGERGSLMLLDEAEKVLFIGVAFGLSDEITKETRVGIGEPVAGWVMETGQPLFVKDVKSDHAFLAIKKENIMQGTLMCVPLIAKDKLLGVLNVSKSEPNSFQDRDFELFKNLANQAAIAIENAMLYRFAVTDEMTRLYNHRYFQHRLDEELQRADRYDNRVSLIILDVDHFKKFNDTYGHPEGDRVLKTVSRLIEKSVREVDIPARYGGEEFVVICPEKDAEGTLVPAERIRTTIEEYDFRINGERVPIAVSLGVSCYPDLARSKADLIISADTALYYSKENGRNQSTLFMPNMKIEEMLAKKAAKKQAAEQEKAAKEKGQ